MTRAEALHARAGRAHEDPYEMTVDALLGRLAHHVVAIVKQNPGLDDKSVAKGARLRLRAEMNERAQKSAEVRAARRAS